MERREPYPTDTQHAVNFSGYVWSVRQMASLRGMRVLDIACGAGYGSDYVAGFAQQVVGVDVIPQIVAKCRSEYPNPRVKFLAMDGAALGFRDETFDAIISHDTIEHVVDDRSFVKELVRVLRPGGTLLLFTPHGKERGKKPEDPFHIREYIPEDLQALLAPYFRSIRWFGRRQGARLKAVEGHMDRVRRWDPLGLRRLIPRKVRHWLGGLTSRLQGGVPLDRIGPEDIEYVEGFHDDTNLIALCAK